MKNLIYLSALVSSIIIVFGACNKSSNSYTVTDHTVGMVNVRLWSGTANGYTKGDTLLTSGDTTYTAWPKIYSRLIHDSSFSVQKINGFEVSVLGTPLAYRLTDSVNKTIRFDSLVTGSLTGILIYYFNKDSMTFQYDNVFGYNVPDSQYYQAHIFLHTN